MNQQKNEMETLAEAAFYVQDVVKGRIGKFKVEEEGWGQGGAAKAYGEIAFVLKTLKDAGFKDRAALALEAPYTGNIRRGVYYKRFPGNEKRWVVLILAERFGVDATFEVMDTKPWS